jgi:hypothetical protein
MKHKLIRVSVFVLILIVAEKLIGRICKKLYARSNQFEVSKLRYTIDSTREAILIFGSSRAEYHFIPEKIRNVTGLSSYNCGIGGADLLVSKIQLNEALKRSKPRFIIVEASPSSFFILNPEENRKILLPFYDKDTLIYNTLTENKTFEKIKFVSSIYPYNSTIASLLKGMIRENTDSLNGFKPATGLFDTSGITDMVNKTYSSPVLPEGSFTYLSQIVEICRKNNIRIVIVSAPVYQVNKNHDEMVNQLQIFCSENQGVSYRDYTKNELTYKKKHLFKDNTHLNYDGARIFSEMFANNLKEIIAPARSSTALRK